MILHHGNLEQLERAGINGGNSGAGDWFQATQDPFWISEIPFARCQFATKIAKESSNSYIVLRDRTSLRNDCLSCVFVAVWLNSLCFQHKLVGFVQDGDLVVWRLGIADFGTEGTSEREGAKVKVA